MPDTTSTPNPADFDEAAAKSVEAGIADETAGYDGAADTGKPRSIDKGDPASTSDGSGTSETD